MQAAAEPHSAISVRLQQPVRGLLRCHENRLSGSSPAAARVRDDVTEQAPGGWERSPSSLLLPGGGERPEVLLQPELADSPVPGGPRPGR